MAIKSGKGIGHLIRALRKRAGLSIANLAELSSLDPSYLNHLELNKVTNPTLSTLSAIAAALKVSPADLFSLPEAKPADKDFQIEQAVRVLLLRHSKDGKADLLAVLKALQNPSRLQAVRNLLRR